MSTTTQEQTWDAERALAEDRRFERSLLIRELAVIAVIAVIVLAHVLLAR